MALRCPSLRGTAKRLPAALMRWRSPAFGTGWHSYGKLRDRREAILASLGKRGLLNEELRKAVLSAETMAVLEDTYLPYRPKRRTRAAIARERGLEPLALRLWGQGDFDVTRAAGEYINLPAGVESVEEALSGARDIIAERVSEWPTARREIRKLFWSEGTISATVASGKDAAATKYQDYFAWQEPLDSAPSHRILAMLRGEKEALLSVRIAPPVSAATAILERIFVRGETEAAQQIRLAIRGRYRPLLESPMETEVRKAARVRAEDTAIRVFADNLRELLLAPALGQKNTLALDPGFRSGCKLVCLDRQGHLLHHDTVYPLLGERGEAEAAGKILLLCRQYHIEAIAVGNGTGGRETEAFLRTLELDPQNCGGHGQRERSLGPTQRRRRRELNSRIRTSPSGGRSPSVAGSWIPGRVGQDRSQVHRCGPVPARR